MLLLLAIAVLAQLAGRLDVPYPVFLVAGGLAIALVPGIPRLRLEPDVVFLVFLPPLLYAAAFTASPRDLRAPGRAHRAARDRPRRAHRARRGRGRAGGARRAVVADGVRPRRRA